MKTIEFNTGRKYTAHGQRIKATLYDDGTVTFHDKDRMIVGEYTEHFLEDFGKASVLSIYDIGSYKNSAKAHADGFMAGGCNTF